MAYTFSSTQAPAVNPIFFGCKKQQTAFESGDFSTCTNALNRSMRAMEEAQVSYTIWCYQPDNTNEYGDGWNQEDLSLFSKSQVVPGDEDNLFAGGRSLLAAIRPYPFKVSEMKGVPRVPVNSNLTPPQTLNTLPLRLPATLSHSPSWCIERIGVSL